MAIIKCKMCGGALNITERSTVAECEYCGTTQTVPTADSEKKLTLFGRANRLRLACEFDKAAGVYESIVAEFPEEAEAYWGLVLCRYGIEYVDDPRSGKKIPTCHRSSFDSIMEDSDFEQTLENADVVARKVYREEAKAIEELRKGILEVSGREEPYDIFICYKETDENGERTIDSVIAQDVYDALTEKGYRVFFSRISLEDKLGTEYEPYIFAALNSAKVMLAFGTDYEYYNAVWVKNEWSRFLALIAAGQKKTLIPCYKGTDAYDMPKEFQRLQAQNMGKVGAIQDLLRGIDKITGKGATVRTQEAVTIHGSSRGPSADAVLKRGNMALEDSRWDEAFGCFDRALDIDTELAQAYLGMAMAYAKCRTEEEFRERYTSLAWEADSYTLRAKQYATPEIKKMFERWDAEKTEKTERAAEEARIAAEKAAEEARIAKERAAKEAAEKAAKEAARIAELRQFYVPYRKRSALASRRVCVNCKSYRKDIAYIGLNLDGSVTGFEFQFNRTPHRYVKDWYIRDWTALVAVAASFDFSHIVGLKSNGSVVAVGLPGEIQCEKCKVGGWTDVVDIAVGISHTVGLKADGTVVAVGDNKDGQCDVSSWMDIVAIATGRNHTVGLKSDGTVVAVGDNKDGQCSVSSWTDIVAVTASGLHTVGLKVDGTVVAVGDNKDGQCDVGSWTDIVDIAAGSAYTVGLKADGTVLAVGSDKYGSCAVSDWKDIVAVDTDISGHAAVGVRADGTVLITSDPYSGSSILIWKPFNNIDTLEQEIAQAKEKRRQKEELCALLEKEKSGLKTEMNNLKGLFTGKRRKEIETQLEEIEEKLKKL